MRASLDFGAQNMRVYIGSEDFVLLLEPDVKATNWKLVEGEDLGAPTEDWTSD